MSQSHHNHYVPIWYQKRFIATKVGKYHYLDLSPEEAVSPGGVRYTRRALRHLGPDSCFAQDDLYTVQIGSWSNDEIERYFFGPIDDQGRDAVEFFADFSFRKGVKEAFHNLVRFMDAQRIRTPRGLDWLQSLTNTHSNNATLMVMQKVHQAHATMWTEGIWEIVRARDTKTKFIVSDGPVTYFNARAFPSHPDFAHPNDASLFEVGTRTLFPLSLDACLIITHVQFVRRPNSNPRRPRVHARTFDAGVINLAEVQYGRELEEDEVRRINFILKKRATRYVAAADPSWLHPEEHVGNPKWSTLDDDWFLFPNPYKVKFTTGLVAGWKDGSSKSVDEYGREREHPQYGDERRRDREWKSFRRAHLEWVIKREGRSLAQIDEDKRSKHADEHIMESDLKEAKEAEAKSRVRRRRNRH